MEQVTDSSRFFAVRVVDSGRKAMLGIGFEERSEAFDFGVSLQEVRRHNNLEGEGAARSTGANNKKGGAKKAAELAPVEKKDYSLKEGETINITIGVMHHILMAGRVYCWLEDVLLAREQGTDDLCLEQGTPPRSEFPPGRHSWKHGFPATIPTTTAQRRGRQTETEPARSGGFRQTGF